MKSESEWLPYKHNCSQLIGLWNTGLIFAFMVKALVQFCLRRHPGTVLTHPKPAFHALYHVLHADLLANLARSHFLPLNCSGPRFRRRFGSIFGRRHFYLLLVSFRLILLYFQLLLVRTYCGDCNCRGCRLPPFSHRNQKLRRQVCISSCSLFTATALISSRRS
jgi:hypothetical protein